MWPIRGAPFPARGPVPFAPLPHSRVRPGIVCRRAPSFTRNRIRKPPAPLRLARFAPVRRITGNRASRSSRPTSPGYPARQCFGCALPGHPLVSSGTPGGVLPGNGTRTLALAPRRVPPERAPRRGDRPNTTTLMAAIASVGLLTACQVIKERAGQSATALQDRHGVTQVTMGSDLRKQRVEDFSRKRFCQLLHLRKRQTRICLCRSEAWRSYRTSRHETDMYDRWVKNLR